MTSNQRRPGFRLPWSTEEEAAAAAASQAEAGGSAPSENEGTPAAGQTSSEESELEAPAAASPAATAAAAPSSQPAPSARPVAEAAPPAAQTAESSAGFMRDLVAAMRRVAEETRQAGLSDLRTKSEERVRSLEADSERRREDLRSAAETDIAGAGEWARKEHERITLEAEQRVVGRRAQLDQQLAAETSRAEAEAQALRDRVAEYERELDAYHAQLSDIADPAAFAAAAKRMPAPPRLGDGPAPAAPAEASAATLATEPKPETEADEEPTPAATEALSGRLAELDATLEPSTQQPEPAPETEAATRGETVATEVLVKGLGSFGAITGFRQALASVDQIDGVSLSLGPTGEFVFRAIHPAGFDVAAAITSIEGDAATIEERPEGGLRVTLDRAR